MTRYPRHMTNDVDDLQRVRSTFFSRATPGSWVARYVQRLRKEPMGKFALDMLVLNLPRTSQVRRPVLVLGAQCDSCVTPREARATRAEVFPDMGHDMMLEPGWTEVAQPVDNWLRTQDL
jgi:pimeloyl-ACP methyl ester carboxylesterase